MDNGTGSPGRHPDVTISEMSNALRNADTPALSTKELAEIVGLSSTAINERMDDILAFEAIQSKKVSNTRIFWHKNLEVKQTWATFGADESPNSEDSEEDTKIGIPEIDDLDDLPGEGETLKLQRAAINLVYQIIRLNGKATSRFLRVLIWNYPFTKAYPSKMGFWNNVISPSLSELSDVFFEKKPNAWYTPEGRREEIREQARERDERMEENHEEGK